MARTPKARAARWERTSAAFIHATHSALTDVSSTAAASPVAACPMGAFVREGEPVSDTDERGVIFMALNASLSRQFEFVQQQWIQYGNDARLGNDKDPLLGNHGGHGRFFVQGEISPTTHPLSAAIFRTL